MKAVLIRIAAAAILLYFSVATIGRHGYLAGLGVACVLYAMFALGRAAERSGKGVA